MSERRHCRRRRKEFVEPAGMPVPPATPTTGEPAQALNKSAPVPPPATHTIGELALALRKSRQTVARAIENKQINVLPLVGEHQRISHQEYLRLTGLDQQSSD